MQLKIEDFITHHGPGARPQTTSLLTFLRVLGRKSGYKGEKMVLASRGVDSQALATMLDPFGAMFVDLAPDSLSET